MSHINLIGGAERKRCTKRRTENIWMGIDWEFYKIDESYESSDSRSTTICK